MARLRDDGSLDYAGDEFKAPKMPKRLLDDLPYGEGPGGFGGQNDNPDFGVTGTADRAGADPNPSTAKAPETPAAPKPSTSGYYRADGGWQEGGAPPGPGGAPPSPYTATPGSSGGQLSQMLMSMLSAGRQDNPDRKALYNRISGLIDTYSKPVDANDPNIAKSVNTYAGTVDRGLNKYRTFAAERAHAEGVPSGAFDSQVGNAMTKGGLAVGNLENQLVQDEMTNRRGFLNDMIGRGAGILDSGDSMALQDKMGTLNAMIGSRGADTAEGRLGLDTELGRGDLSLRKLLGEGNLALGHAGLGVTSHGQDQQNQQFYDRLAFDQSKEGNNLDSLLAQLLLGGG